MEFRRSAQDGAREAPGLLMRDFRWFGGQAQGSLLVHDIRTLQALSTGVEPSLGGPRCLAARPAAAGAVPAAASGALSTASESGGGGPHGFQGFPGILGVALNEEARLQPHFPDIPVPTIFLGGLPAPIPAGRPTIDADALIRQLQQGVLPSDSLPEGDREAWRAASRITDPISAYNICQAQQLAGRRVVLTERGVAEQLARGSLQMAPVGDGGDGPSGQRSGVQGLPNPFAPLLHALSALTEGHQLSQSVQSRAAQMGGGPAATTGGSSSTPVQQQAGGQPASPSAALPGETAVPLSPSPGVPAPSLALQAGAAREAHLQYSLQDSPARRLLIAAGGAPPQLAWVPLRVALQLLRALPQHFMMLQGGERQGRPRAQGSGGQGGGQEQEAEKHGGLDGEQGTFHARNSPSSLSVWIIPGLHVRQATPDGGSVEFTPAFLSHGSAQALWRDMREISGGALLMYRRLERALMRRRLEAAAALIAGGAMRGPQASSGGQQDDEEGGMEEPSEISEFIQELGSSLAQEAGSSGATGSGGAGLQLPSGALPRLVATFATGVVSLAAQGLGWAGNTADWLLMATPLGPRLLGVPDLPLQRAQLSELVGGMEQYNQQQAVLQAMLHAMLQAAVEDTVPGVAAGDEQPPPVQQVPAQQMPTQQAQQQQEQQPAAAASPPAAAAADQGAADANAQAPFGGQAAAAAAAAAFAAQQAKQRAREAKAALGYRQRLAAACLWVALGVKQVGETPQVRGASLARMFAKSFLQQGSAVSAAMLGGGSAGLGSGGGTGLGSSQYQATLPTGAPSLGAPPLAPPGDIQEALEQVLAAGLPVLEHNGFQHLFKSTGTGTAPAGSSGGRAAAAAAAAASTAALAAAIAGHCTGDTQLGLATYARDGATGGLTMIEGNPLSPAPTGRGLMLVGDLDLGQRQRGRSASRTQARWLTVGVDDGRKLL